MDTAIYLKNICKKATGVEDFTYEFDNSGYNKGRLVTIEYNNQIIYITIYIYWIYNSYVLFHI